MKSIIPAAGLGTRFLPGTKVTPKEMLPVLDKPVIQYVVEEALASAREMEDFRSRNFCVQGSRDEILALIDQVAPTSLQVDHIFLTPLSE